MITTGIGRADAEMDACFGGFDTEDFRESYGAFLAKQSPAFKGR